MEKKSNFSLFVILAIFAIAGLLLLNHWFFSGIIVAMVILHGARMSWKYGKAWWQKRQSKVAQRERFILLLASLMILFLATGTALYLWAFYTEGDDDHASKFVNAEYLFRSLFCSFQLFTANIDSNVLDGIKGHEYIKGMISVQAVLSFSCTLAVLISFAYARVRAFVKLHRQTKVDNEHNHLYVFFGINEPSRLLAKSIWNKEKDRALIVFVENSRVDDDDKSGWNNIVGMFTHRRQTFTDADEVNARVTFTETRLCDVEMEKKDSADVFGEINLLKLKELIQQLSTTKDAKLYMFFFSDNEDENIRAVSVLAADATIHDVNDKIQQRFYCHARRNGLNRVVEDIAVKRGLEVQIIDSSYLSIELLKADEKNHPVRLVDVDKDNPTTVKSEFNSLVVGFDEAGQDALKFLYEFGAFVDSEATPEHEMRSPFHCIATDKRMEELKCTFTTFAPLAMTQRNKDGSKLIELKQCDCKSSDFFESVITLSLRKKLNYVVIAVGDDELGMILAIRILNHIRRDREDLSRLRIYVRSYRSDRESYMQKIADYYNEGYNKDNEKNKSYQTGAIIIPFGQKEKIYSYEMIINEELTEKGKKFQKGYATIKGESELWEDRRKLLTGITKKVTNEEGKRVIVNVPVGERVISLNDIRSLRRKERQDLDNALHVDTKINLLLQSVSADFDWEDFYSRYFDDDNKPQCEGSYDKRRYSNLTTKENQMILNLARLEHLRWNASHEMLGYTKAIGSLHGCDERTRQHNCLRPWQELDKEGKIVTQLEGWTADYKSYDFCVVDNSILLNKEKLILK